MAYKIKFKSSVERDLKKIDKSQLKIIFEKIETELVEKADQFPALTGNFAGLRKYRVGDYRLIYSLLDDTVLILRIAHRKEAYK
ncbi:MAG TPA: type II toxin-antitoxin system RelE/ParE family toxin [bacterium]|nr:type II toxin-antitoxin system RelE/ParE family toxin [bacterium]